MTLNLPRGAKGLKFGEIGFVFAKNKVVFFSKNGIAHHTLHLGPASRVIDLHETMQLPDGVVKHRTLFRISHPDAQAALERLGMELIEVIRGLARPITPAMISNNLLRAVMVPTYSDLTSVGHVRHQKLDVEPKRLTDSSRVLGRLEQLYDLQDGERFLLFRQSKGYRCSRIGLGFAVVDRRNYQRLYWIPDSQMRDALRRATELILGQPHT